MNRGEVWWAEVAEPIGSRPVIILTRSAVLGSLGSIVVCIVTRTVRGLRSEVRIGRKEGLLVPCVANLDNILTIPKGRLTRRMGALDKARVTELNNALLFALGVAE